MIGLLVVRDEIQGDWTASRLIAFPNNEMMSTASPSSTPRKEIMAFNTMDAKKTSTREKTSCLSSITALLLLVWFTSREAKILAKNFADLRFCNGDFRLSTL